MSAELCRTVAVFITASSIALAQGVAVSGRKDAERRPLPDGVGAPTVDLRDIASQAGLTGITISGAEREKKYILESAGTGVAILDYDQDGLQDVLVLSAGRLDDRDPAPRHHLYRNLGNLRFEESAEKAGLVHRGWPQGVCAGDANGDGLEDLFIAGWQRSTLLLNRGDATFSDETEAAGLLERGRWGTGCAFLDYDQDGDLDLFIAHYIAFDLESAPEPGQAAECRWNGLPVLCGPRGLPPESMSLYRNDGSGRFEDVTKAAGIGTEKLYYGFSPVAADFDSDGLTDIFVACDSTANLLFHNQGQGRFAEVGTLSGTAYNMDGQEQAGMGAVAADFDGDGALDIFKTNFAQDLHTLYRNEGEMFFSDDTVSAGLGVNTRYVGWGAAALDVDNDGRPDVFAANGHVYPNVADGPGAETYKQPRLLYWNIGESVFHDISSQAGPALLARHSSRGVAAGDLDNDGKLEIVVANLGEPPSLLRNYASAGAAVLIEVLETSGRAAVGARVRVLPEDGPAQIGEVRSGGSYLSQNDLRLHFGSGRAEEVAVEVRWATGDASRYDGLPVNAWIRIRRGKEKPEVRTILTGR